MKLFYVLIISIFFFSCSFDNKTGIWENENKVIKKGENNIFKDFKKITFSEEVFDKIITLDKKFKFDISEPYRNKSWTDTFYNKNNNLNNFKYTGLNKEVLRSKKLTKYKVSEYILFEKNNLISSDHQGNIIVFSINNRSVFAKFNFYKKKYRNIKKSLNLIVENNIIYVSDNIGYIYAYNYLANKILWAKNYKVPFRSNLKLFSNHLVTANQNNDLFIFDKNTGRLIKLIPSEDTIINNSFINNISLNNDLILFLNTYGSLYSIDKKNFRLNWFINLNKSLDLNLSNLFFGSKIVNYENKILVSSNENFYVIDSKSGFITSKKNFSTKIRPVVNKNNIFLVTKNNFLIVMNLKNTEIIYSHDLNKKLSDFKKIKRNLEIKNLMLVNSNIFLFIKNSHIVKLDIKGNLLEVTKVPSNLNSQPIFIDNSLLYLDKKNKLLIVN